MFKTNSVQQSNNTSDKITGRDDNSETHNHYYNSPVVYREDITLKRLLEEHEKEKEKDSNYQEFSNKLNNFFREKSSSKLRNLEGKLIDGKRESFIGYALEAKERVTKKIHKYSLYISAQEIYTYLLSNIRASFKHQVESKIKSGRFELYEIDDLVRDKIIEPFYSNVQGSSLAIDLDELYGLLYLLTGNCYIEWD